MATLRDIRRRIKSVRNTQQITKAMEMVSAAKLRRAQGRLEAARPYGRKMREMLENLAAVAAEVQHPLFEVRPVERRVLVVVTGDRGLAGSYNGAVIRRAEAYLKSPEGARTALVTVGRKGRDYFRRRQVPVLRQYTDLGDPVNLLRAQAMSREIVDLFLNREALIWRRRRIIAGGGQSSNLITPSGGRSSSIIVRATQELSPALKADTIP